ncbi:MAG: hypothetical protein Q8P50_00840, partial [Bacillota bacterium]|nr:hypothetical protein [Bacillota bacterium]
MYDILIKGGRIYDGGGKEPFEADVAIKGGKIVSVGATGAGEAARTIDASGLAFMPGAIDALASDQDFKAMSWAWRTFGEYLSALEKKGIGTNLVPIVGQSLIRAH